MSTNSEDCALVPSTASAIKGSATNQPGPMSATDFIEAIRQGQTRDWNGCQISGNVDLTGVKVEHSLVIQGAVFTGTVNFSQARFERGVNFTKCRFHKLILSDARVEGGLILDNIVIDGETQRIFEIIARLEDGCRRAWSRRRNSRDNRIRRRQRLIYRRRWMSRRQRQEKLRDAGVKSTSAEFDNLRVAGCLSMMQARVAGGLSCNHAEIEDDFRVDGTHIYGSLSLRHTSLGEFCTDGRALVANAGRGEDVPFRVHGNLDLTSATIAGDLRLIGVMIRGELTLQAADISGNLLCRSSERVRNRLNSGAWLLVMHVRGVVDFGGTRLHGNLNLEAGKIDGNFQCSRAGKWFSTVRGDVLLNGAKIGNEVSFVGAHLIGILSLQNTSIGGNLNLRATSDLEKNVRCKIKKAWLLSVTVAGDVDISGAQICDDLIMQNANIEQNFMAVTMGGFQSHVDGHIDLNGARIRGAVEFRGAILRGELGLDGASIGGDLLVTFDLNDADDWQVVRSSVGGRIHAESAIIGKRVVLMGLTVRPTDRKDISSKVEEPGVSFAGAQINGELLLHSQGLVREHLQSKKASSPAKEISPERERKLPEDARPERTEIYGDFRLTRAQVLGGITLDAIRVEGELDLQDANVRANINCRPIDLSPDEPHVRASVHRADFEALNMTGDINLTGLTISGKQGDGPDGDLILRDAEIRGRLELCPPDHGGNPTEDPRYNDKLTVIWGALQLDAAEISHAILLCPPDYGGNPTEDPRYNDKLTIIRGALRLDAAEISHAILSGRNFLEKDTVHARHLWKDLRAAWHQCDSLVMLLLRGGQPEGTTAVRIGLERATIGRLQILEPLPGTLDLSDLKVGRWDLPRGPSDEKYQYKEMLENSFPFRKSNYLAIEHALQNDGMNEQADEVHVLMRRRDRRNIHSCWMALLDRLLDLSTKYGTTSTRLVSVMLILFVISVWVFNDRNHVEYEIAPLGGKPPPVEHPAPASWSVGDAVLLALRLHVPIISLGVDEKVQPSGTRLKAYAVIVVAGSWVMWPLLIASVSGYLRKRN